MKNAKIKNRQKLSMLVVTMVLVLLMTLIAGIFTGCGKNAGGGLDGTESSGANADGSAGGGKGRFIESKVALPEEINSILQFKALSDGTLEVVGQDADYSIYVAKSSDGGGSWETTPLEDISYGDVAVAEDGTVRFLITQKTDYVRLQLWTRTEAHIHFRLKCLQKMPLYQLQHLTVTNS